MMCERSIWHSAVLDIVSVLQIPRITDTLPLLSSQELRRKAIHMTRLDSHWYQKTLLPKNTRRHHCSDDVCRVEIINGGEWAVVLCRDGKIQLHEMADFSNPRFIMLHYAASTDMLEMGISYSLSHGIMAHVTERGWNARYVNQ